MWDFYGIVLKYDVVIGIVDFVGCLCKVDIVISVVFGGCEVLFDVYCFGFFVVWLYGICVLKFMVKVL